MANFRFLLTPWGVLKMTQLVIALVCIALLRYYDLSFGGEQFHASTRDRYLLGVITIGGMILVTLPVLVAYIFGSETSPTLDLINGVMGSVLFFISGVLCIENYHTYRHKPGNLNAGRSLGSLMIINSVFYILDVLIALRNMYDK